MNVYQKCRKWLTGDYSGTHTDIYDRAKAELLVNASLLVYIVLLPLLIYTVANGLHEKTIPTLIGLFFVTLQLLLFRKFRSTWWSAFFLCSITSVLLSVNINFNEREIHLVEPFWMIVIVVFAVFMMGVKWGIFFCTILMTGFTFFVMTKLEANLRIVIDAIPSTRYFMVMEIAAALFTLTYILSMFVITTKRAEQALREVNANLGSQNRIVHKQNSEITVLLKEIHHRVKNNLQVINSLLRLQSARIRDRESRKVFDDAQYRIQAIALIHERMYKSAELSNIDPNTYFRKLAYDLLRQHQTGAEIGLSVEVNLEEWSQDTVVPLGLLLNELIANSVEHGDLGENGRIAIRLGVSGESLELTYSDNGRGFAENYTTGFGLELIETLCAQLDGVMDRVSTPGKGVLYAFALKRMEVPV